MDDKTASIALKHCIPGSSIWKISNKNISHIHTDICWLSWFSKQPLRHGDLLNSVACVCKYFQYLALLLASIHKFRCTVYASLNLITFLCFLTSWQWYCLSFLLVAIRVCTYLFKPYFILLHDCTWFCTIWNARYLTIHESSAYLGFFLAKLIAFNKHSTALSSCSCKKKNGHEQNYFVVHSAHIMQ